MCVRVRVCEDGVSRDLRRPTPQARGSRIERRPEVYRSRPSDANTCNYPPAAGFEGIFNLSTTRAHWSRPEVPLESEA